MTVQTEVYAKPGELIQGLSEDDIPFLFSNKSSSRFKTITTIHPQERSIKALHPKSKQAVQLFMDTLEECIFPNIHPEKHLTQQSNVPVGKGLSSSSTDVLGILQTLSQFYNTGYSIEKLYALAAQIEPTDPCLHPGSVLFQQQQGHIMHTFTELPFRILYFDSEPDLRIDTINFSKHIRYTPQQKTQFQELQHLMCAAFESADYPLFYQCLLTSANINQTFLPKKNIERLQDFAFQHKVGLFVAHSGTYMGLVMKPETENQLEAKAMNFIKQHWNTPIYIE